MKIKYESKEKFFNGLGYFWKPVTMEGEDEGFIDYIKEQEKQGNCRNLEVIR